MTRNQTKFAYKLALETLVSEISIRMPPSKTCGICFDDDLEAEQMFSVTLCHHQFYVKCVRQHIQVGLLEETSVPRFPHYGCKSNLTVRSCAHLLKPKRRAMWEQRIKEDSMIHVLMERFYFPNPNKRLGPNPITDDTNGPDVTHHNLFLFLHLVFPEKTDPMSRG